MLKFVCACVFCLGVVPVVFADDTDLHISGLKSNRLSMVVAIDLEAVSACRHVPANNRVADACKAMKGTLEMLVRSLNDEGVFPSNITVGLLVFDSISSVAIMPPSSLGEYFGKQNHRELLVSKLTQLESGVSMQELKAPLSNRNVAVGAVEEEGVGCPQLTINRHLLIVSAKGLFSDLTRERLFGYLDQWMMQGVDQYHFPTTPNELLSMLSDISDSAASIQGSVSSSVVSTDSLSSLDHGSSIYYSLFQPTKNSFWYGNVKRYQLGSNSEGRLEVLSYPEGGRSESALVSCEDFQGRERECFAHGKDNSSRARSWWNNLAIADGNIVTQGGAAVHQAPLGERNIYLQVGPKKLERLTGAGMSTMELESVSDGTALHFLRQRFLASVLKGIDRAKNEDWLMASKSTKSKVADRVNWLLGQDKVSDKDMSVGAEYYHLFNHYNENKAPQLEPEKRFSRPFYGAVLHSRPLIVHYGGNGGVEREVLFTSSSDGFLRAVDTESGKELSAVFPSALLKNVSGYMEQAPGALIHGWDGQWTVWRHDGDGDGEIKPSSKDDFVYIYGGMRRGGRHFYGFDVTDPRKPSLLFDLSPNSHVSLTRMGQIWSEPTLAWVRLPSVDGPVAVLLLSGGYDVNYDKGRESKDAINCEKKEVQCGNQILMVLAQKTAGSYRAGDVVWWSSSDSASNLVNSEMKDSIIGSVRVLDENGDGYFDRFYVVDIVGRVFVYSYEALLPKGKGIERRKVDVSDLRVGVLAELGANKGRGKQEKRYFYSSPSLSIGQDGHGNYRLITIGSGWRANPLTKKSSDAFFAIKDRFNSLPAGNSIRGEELLPVNSNLNSEGLISSLSRDGFSMFFINQGEKALESPTVVDGKVFFSTYTPSDPSPFVCEEVQGSVTLYGIDINSGFGLFNGSGGVAEPVADNSYTLKELPLSYLGLVRAVISKEKIHLLSGLNVIGTIDAPKNKVRRVSWHEAARGNEVEILFPLAVEPQ